MRNIYNFITAGGADVVTQVKSVFTPYKTFRQTDRQTDIHHGWRGKAAVKKYTTVTADVAIAIATAIAPAA